MTALCNILPRLEGTQARYEYIDKLPRIYPDGENNAILFHAHAYRLAVSCYQPLLPFPISLQESTLVRSCRMTLNEHPYYNPSAVPFSLEQPLSMPGEDNYRQRKQAEENPLRNLRKPYGATIQEMRRYASFIETSNQKDLLTDPSGSRRFICIEVTGSIDTNVTINYRQLYAQAMHDIVKGERCWLDDTDEAVLKQSNREFEQVNPLEQLFQSHFRAAEEGEAEGKWLMPMQILGVLQTKTRDRLSISKVAAFGRILRKLNIPNNKANVGTLYHVIEL